MEGRWSDEERNALPICDLELAASTLGLIALQPECGKQFVYSFTDNTVAMAAMRNLTPATACMQRLTSARVAWMLGEGVWEACERITSKSNLWADMGSRARVAELMAQASRLGFSTRRVAVPSGWREMVAAEAEAVVLAQSGGSAERLASPPALPQVQVEFRPAQTRSGLSE